MNNGKAKIKLWDMKRNCGYYFSRLISRPFVPPEQAYFALTNKCNLKCKMCDVIDAENNSNDELDTKECKDIIDEIVNMNIDHLVFSGGEPLLRKDIFELIGYAVSKKIRIVDMITNGQLVTEETANHLVSSGLKHITFSLDGLEKANDAIRGIGIFKKTTVAMDLINRSRKNFIFPTIAINFTIMDQNIADILPIIDLAQEKRCNYILFQPVLYNNKKMHERLKKDDLWVKECNVPKLREIIKELLRRKTSPECIVVNVDRKILQMMPDYFLGKRLNNSLKCYEAIVRIVICHNGDLWSCHGVYGNLKRDSLMNCWSSNEAKVIRNKVKRCNNHCLQPCVYLPGPVDLYFS